MSNIVLGYNNVADNATYDVNGVWSNINNLKDKRLAVYASSFNALLQTTQFKFDLGSVYPVTILDIANHNLTESAFWRARFGLAPFDADFSNGTIDGRITGTSSNSGTVFGENGLLTAAGTTGRLDFDRLVYVQGFINSEDLTANGWGFSTGSKALDSKTVSFNPIGNMQFGQFNSLDLAVDTYTLSGWVRLVSGDGTFAFGLSNGTSSYTSSNVVATKKWVRFSLSVSNTIANFLAGGSAYVTRAGLGTSAIIQFKHLQFQRGTTPAWPTFPYRISTTTRIFACRGLLCEEARTNLCLQSAALDNASWTKGATIITANSSTGLFGTTTMDFMKEDSTTALHQVTSASITYSTNSYYVCSTFAKVGVGTRNLQLIMSLSANGFAIGTFTVNSGTFTTTGTGSVGGTNPFSNAKTFAIPMGGGIYWLILVAQTGATAGAGSAIYRLDNNSGGSYVGDNTSGHYLEGMDVQPGSQPCSHIPTTTATVTRAADTYSVSGTNFTNWFSQGQGSLYGEFSTRFDSTATVTNDAVVLNDGTGNNRVELNTRTSDDLLVATLIAGGVQQASQAVGITAPYDGTYSRIAQRYVTNNIRSSFNGTSATAVTTATIPSTFSVLTIGCSATGASYLNGWVRRVTWWANPLDDTYLPAITTSGPSAYDFDTGWVSALQFGFAGDVPSDWGKRGYNLIALPPASMAARYGTIEIADPNNADPNHITLGRLFLSNGLQTGINADFSNYADSRNDLSSVRDAEAGNKFSSVRRRKKQTTMTFSMLSQDEANTAHEIQDAVGITDEVIFIPDPADAAMTQRYGGLGYLSKLDSVLYRFINLRSMSFSWEEKI